MPTLNELSASARALANGLFSGRDDENIVCSNQRKKNKDDDWDPSCIQKEENRPLTKAEKAHGATRRGFSAYDHRRMCDSCASYWFAEMAAQTLHQMYCWAQRDQAKAERCKL